MKLKRILLAILSLLLLCGCSEAKKDHRTTVEESDLLTTQSLVIYDYGTEVFSCYYSSGWYVDGVQTDCCAITPDIKLGWSIPLITVDLKWEDRATRYYFKGPGLAYSLKTNIK